MPFEARDYPELIDLAGEIVVGPFCVHCGYPFSLHGEGLACRVVPNIVLRPSCDCHEIQEVETSWWEPVTGHLRIKRRRVRGKRLLIVRK